MRLILLISIHTHTHTHACRDKMQKLMMMIELITWKVKKKYALEYY